MSLLSETAAQRAIDSLLTTGADFAELFLERTYTSSLTWLDSRPSGAVVGTSQGAGIRAFFGNEEYYTHTSDYSEHGLLRAVEVIAAMQSSPAKAQAARFNQVQHPSPSPVTERPWDTSKESRFAMLAAADRAARSCGSGISQVEAQILERLQVVQIANSEGVFTGDERCYSRFYVTATAEAPGIKETGYYAPGALRGADFFRELDLEALARKAAGQALRKLSAEHAPAGIMPVVIAGGFGGVIFHEACGHGLETTSIAKRSSVFCDLLGQKIAAPCVTAIDDGTIPLAWGSLAVDDEGMAPQKTVLIDQGVLKSYMVDLLGSRKTGYQRTGSGRRQSYKYAPTSRMRNTYIAPGSATLEQMIGAVERGLYAKDMGGGSVNTSTGEYNFSVREAYLIEQGRLGPSVKGATLIGTGKDTLANISMVGDCLEHAEGMCGAQSGSLPVCVGQPSILVSSILVGGRSA